MFEFVIHVYPVCNSACDLLKMSHMLMLMYRLVLDWLMW